MHINSFWNNMQKNQSEVWIFISYINRKKSFLFANYDTDSKWTNEKLRNAKTSSSTKRRLTREIQLI